MLLRQIVALCCEDYTKNIHTVWALLDGSIWKNGVTFVNSTTDGVEWPATCFDHSVPKERSPGNYCAANCVSLTADLGALGKRKSIVSTGSHNPNLLKSSPQSCLSTE